VRGANQLAKTAVAAANSQSIAVPGKGPAALLIARVAQNVIAINRQLAEVDELIDERFSKHRLRRSSPAWSVGDLLGAEFLAAAGEVRTRFESADHLAGYAGLAPIPRDSGTQSGNLHPPRRYNRQLQRVFYTSALISIQHSAASRAFYDQKRAEGKRHTQAVMALARRRVNVLWAMLRDQRRYLETPIDGATAA